MWRDSVLKYSTHSIHEPRNSFKFLLQRITHAPYPMQSTSRFPYQLYSFVYIDFRHSIAGEGRGGAWLKIKGKISRIFVFLSKNNFIHNFILAKLLKKEKSSTNKTFFHPSNESVLRLCYFLYRSWWKETEFSDMQNNFLAGNSFIQRSSLFVYCCKLLFL